MKNNYHPPRFYRGEMDDKTGTAEHGAVLNVDYNKIMVEGPWGEPKMQKVREGVYCLTGFAVANFTLIESDNGFILIDTGLNRGCGEELLRRKAEVSDKPIVAIIFSHNHYTGGARAIIEAHPDREIPIYGNPKTQGSIFGLVDPGTLRHAGDRAAKQMGMFLPKTGPDSSATYGFCIPQFDDPALNVNGHLAVTHEVQDGDEVVIDGVKVCFHHVTADAPDSLISYFPNYDLIQHNTAIMPVMFPLYTLRGGEYRNPNNLIDGINKIREICPEYLIGCHGNPVSGKDDVYQLATLHRDAYAFLFQQTLQGISRGLSPDELVQQIHLPKHVNENLALFPAYIDVEYIVRGIYLGVIGWWATDTADLHPPTQQEMGEVIVEGFGGVDAVINRGRKAMEANQYNLVAKLMSFTLSVEPDNAEAKQLKADALRKMAQTTRSGIQTRNFLLTEARELEGQNPVLNRPEKAPLVNMSITTVLETSPAIIVRLMENHFNPIGVEQLSVVVLIYFSDLDQGYGLAIRHGAVEFLTEAPSISDIQIRLPFTDWAKIAVGQVTLQDIIEEGSADVSGEQGLVKNVMDAYKGILSRGGLYQ